MAREDETAELRVKLEQMTDRLLSKAGTDG